MLRRQLAHGFDAASEQACEQYQRLSGFSGAWHVAHLRDGTANEAATSRAVVIKEVSNSSRCGRGIHE